MHHANTGRLSIMYPAESLLASVDVDLAFILACWINASQNFNQRGFTCAVFSYKSMDLGRPHLQIHAFERACPGKTFCDMRHADQRKGILLIEIICVAVRMRGNRHMRNYLLGLPPSVLGHCDCGTLR